MNTILLFLLSLVGHFTARLHQPGHVKPGDAPFLQEGNPNEWIQTLDQRRLVSAGVTVWQQGVYRMDSITSSFTVPNSTLSDQTSAISLMLPGNHVAVVWFSSHLQFSGGPAPVMMLGIFNGVGVPIIDEVQINPDEHQLVVSASMEVMQDGFIVSWTGGTNPMNGNIDLHCYQQLFYFNGTKKGPNSIINSLTNNDYSSNPEVVTNQNNSEFLFTWTSTPIDSSSYVVNGSDSRMQRFSGNPFQKIGNNQVANGFIPADQIRPMPFYFSSANFMVLWLDTRNIPVSGEYDLYAHLFNQNGGSLFPNDLKVNGEKVQGTLARERVADLGNDNALVFWVANSLTTSRSSVFYRIVETGLPLINPINEIAPTTEYDKSSPGVSIVLDEFVLMYWSDVKVGGPVGLTNITAQLFTKDMTALGPVFTLGTAISQQPLPYIVSKSESGLLLLTWESLEVHNPGFSVGIFGQVFQLIGPTMSPTKNPTQDPTHDPTTRMPSVSPTRFPSIPPTFRPTNSPTTALSAWWKKSRTTITILLVVTGCLTTMGVSYFMVRRIDNINAREAKISQVREKKLEIY